MPIALLKMSHNRLLPHICDQLFNRIIVFKNVFWYQQPKCTLFFVVTWEIYPLKKLPRLLKVSHPDTWHTLFAPTSLKIPFSTQPPITRGHYPLSLEVQNLKLYCGPEERKPSKCIEKWLLVEEPQDFLARKL